MRRSEPPRAEPSPIVRWVLWGLAFKLTLPIGHHEDPERRPDMGGLDGDDLSLLDAADSGVDKLVRAPVARRRFTTGRCRPCSPSSSSRRSRSSCLRASGRRAFIACALMILLQVGIGATGNYGFFNLLTIVLYLALLDDRTLRRGADAHRSGRRSRAVAASRRCGVLRPASPRWRSRA